MEHDEMQPVQSKLWKTTVIGANDQYQEAPEVIYLNGVAICTLGNFSASIGKAKSKKTFNVSAIVASAISYRRVLNYETDFPEGRDRVLYIDTEQSKAHCQRVLNRILRLAGLPDGVENERLTFLSLRKYRPEDRIKIIEEAIADIQGLGLVIVDGVRDLLYDINNPTESTEVISKVMRWTDEYQFHLHLVLHQNKADDNARGHIGTEVNNKAETVIQVEKDKDDSNISTVQSVHTRAADFEPFAFRINDDAMPELATDYEFKKTGKVGRPPIDISAQYTTAQHEAALAKVFPTPETQHGYGSLVEAIREAYGIGTNKAGDIRMYMLNKRIIIQEGRRYLLNPLRHY
jgi:hypothetical protein